MAVDARVEESDGHYCRYHRASISVGLHFASRIYRDDSIMGTERGRGFCTECKKWGGPLQVIEDTKVELCPPCFERKGGDDYIEALHEIKEKEKIYE